MHRGAVINLSALSARVKLWREDHPHFAADLPAMGCKLEPRKPLVGEEVRLPWAAMAEAAKFDALFENTVVDYYSPCYVRPMQRRFAAYREVQRVELESRWGGGSNWGGGTWVCHWRDAVEVVALKSR